MPQADRNRPIFPLNRCVVKRFVPEEAAGSRIESQHESTISSKAVDDSFVINRRLKLAAELRGSPDDTRLGIRAILQHYAPQSVVLGNEDAIRSAGNRRRCVHTREVIGAPGKRVEYVTIFRIDAEQASVRWFHHASGKNEEPILAIDLADHWGSIAPVPLVIVRPDHRAVLFVQGSDAMLFRADLNNQPLAIH